MKMNLYTENSKQTKLDNDLKTTKKKRLRQENSLGTLTKSFLEFLRDKGTEKININEIMKILKVKKRRIYDITNVLEGIGFIKKLGKNQICLIKKELIEKSQKETAQEGINEIINLKKENEKLETYIALTQKEFQKMNEIQENKNFSYVTVDDLKLLAKSNSQNLIAIKAPQGTVIEIPDKESTMEALRNAEKGEEDDPALLESLKMEHQMFMETNKGEISVYLAFTKNEEKNYDGVLQQRSKNYLLEKK